MSVMVFADTTPCHNMKQGTTRCNPYTTTFLVVTELKRRAALLMHVVDTKRIISIEKKIRVKNGLTLQNLVRKYIKREEKFYYRSEGKKSENQKILKDTGEPQRVIRGEIKNTQEVLIPLIRPKIEILPSEIKPVHASPDSVETNASYSTQVSKKVSSVEKISSKEKKRDQEKRDNYAIYVVKKRDTLLAIAKKFSVNAKTLIEVNELREHATLKEGEKLYIPISQEDLDSIENAVYIVKRGDSLSKIAKHFHVKIRDLKQYNKIRKKSVIHIGQVMILPLPEKLVELKKIEAQKRKAALKKKRERERLARIALKKAERARFLKLSRGLKHKLSVTATAYTSHRTQTDETPFLAAWNNRIRPGMKIIAVSRDLIYKYGISNGKKVRISGLPGIYTVRDKMNKKWRRRIDIYMGTSRWRALRWGRRRVTLYY